MNFTPTTDPWALFLGVAPYSQRILLHSESPGTGKTSAAIMLADARQAECVVLTLSDSMTASDLLGHWVPKGQEFVWHDGPVSRAIRIANTGRPVVLLLNELDHAGPDVQHSCYALLETGKAAGFTLPSNERLSIPESLSIIATMNPDPKEVLTPAELQRFQVVIDLGSNVSPMILAALPSNMRSMVKDGRMASREAFALIELTGKGCDPFMAVQAVLGDERASDYGDALAIALSGKDSDDSESNDSDDSDSDDDDSSEYDSDDSDDDDYSDDDGE